MKNDYSYLGRGVGKVVVYYLLWARICIRSV